MSYQFISRDDKLNIIYNQRSCDFVNHFVFDVFFAIQLLLHVAAKTKNEVGDFIHFLGSLHAFEKDMKGRGIF